MSTDPSKPAAADTQLLLEVVINGYATGKIGSFVQREGGLWAAPGEVRELGLRVPGAEAGAAAELVALASLPGVSARLDGPTQKLYITAATASLASNFLTTSANADADVPFASGTGALVNYDLIDTAVDGEHSTAGLFEARAFSPWGVVASGLLANFDSAERARRGQSETVRLDTSYTLRTRAHCAATGSAISSPAASVGRGRSAWAARASAPISRCAPIW